MILDEVVEMVWDNANKKHYIEKGYIYTKSHDKFIIKTVDLAKRSKVKIKVKCDVCGKERIIKYCEYMKSIENGEYYACSVKCSQEKRIKTNLKIFGVKNAMQNNKIKEKGKRTNLERRGVEYAFQNEDVKEKMKETNIKKRGVEFAAQSEEVKEKTRNTTIERYGEIWINHVPRHNPNSIIYLDLISERLNLKVQHALNGGEKKFVRYYSDGYINEYNISLEWDEREHNRKTQKEKDLKKELFILENFNCQTIRINEKEFLKDIELGIVLVINKINEII